MSARDRILGRIRRAAADVAPPAPLAPPLVPAQAAPTDPVAQFVAQAEKVHATTSRIGSLDDLPAALAEELRGRNLPAAIRTGDDPAFDRDWGTVERTTGPGRIAEPATLTRAEFAVAETGSLVFSSGPDNPVTLNLGSGRDAFRIQCVANERPPSIKEEAREPVEQLDTAPSERCGGFKEPRTRAAVALKRVKLGRNHAFLAIEPKPHVIDL